MEDNNNVEVTHVEEQVQTDLPVTNNEVIEESKEQGEKKPKKKKWVKIVLIILGIALWTFGVLVVLDIFNFGPRIERTEYIYEDDPALPPKDAKYIMYNDGKNDGAVKLNCYRDNNFSQEIDFEKDMFSVGDYIYCKVSYDLKDGFNVSELYYKLNYGSGLNFTGMVNNDYNDIKTNEAGNYKIVTDASNSSWESRFYYEFRVSNTKNVSIGLFDIVFKTISNDYYQTGDYSSRLIGLGSKYYIYEEKSEDYTSISYGSGMPKDDDYYKYKQLGVYDCIENECYPKEVSGDYLLVDDGGYVAYNYKTKESVSLSDYNSKEIHIAAKDTLIGVVIKGEEKDTYYSLEKDKTIITASSISVEDEYIYYYDNEKNWYKGKLIDFYGNQFKPNKNDSKYKLANGNFYSVVVAGDSDGLSSVYFDSNLNPMFNGKAMDDNDIAIVDDKLVNVLKKSFEVYDSTGKKVFTSKGSYKEVYAVDKYIAVVDNNYMLKLLDSSENVVVEFEKLPKDYYFHWMISGYYKYEEKQGVYLVIGNMHPTADEILAASDDFTREEVEDYIKSADEMVGYEFYYIPTTKEKGKIPTIIGGYAKPVLYLYPTKDNTKVSVTFEKPWLLTTTYPKFIKSWDVTANKNGDLYDKNGKYYYGLYWEESGSTKVDFKEGFYVTKDNAIKFLEDKLTTIGLNDKERNEFIMYWLPILEKNGQNLVYFELTKERESYNKLNITPKPDSLLRLAIHVKKVNKKVNIKEQKLPTFKRSGFTAVEWGGVVH